MTKDEVQTAGKEAFKAANGYGLLAIATGVGKSKIGVDLAWEVVRMVGDSANIVIAVPTKKLRDTNWQDEFIKWNAQGVYDDNVQRFCYVSINKLLGQTIDLLILDEGHNITEANSKVFKNNKVRAVLVLTATPPNPNGNETEKGKIEIFNRLGIKTVFTYSLDDAVKDGNVAPYEIRVVECRLDSTTKYIPGGTKAKPFLQTEKGAYEYLSRIVKGMMISGNKAITWKLLERMRLIKNLKSKAEIAKRVMARFLEDSDRYIIFCGSIEQAEKLCQYRYHSKVKDTDLTAFINGTINRIAVVDALNEGHNIPFVDGAYIVQVSSKDKDLVQRIGRTIRARPGHKAIIWIFVTVDTVDEKWLEAALAQFDKNRITYINYKNVI